MTAEGCKKLFPERFLISDVWVNGLAGGSALPHYMVATKFNKQARKALAL